VLYWNPDLEANVPVARGVIDEWRELRSHVQAHMQPAVVALSRGAGSGSKRRRSPSPDGSDASPECPTVPHGQSRSRSRSRSSRSRSRSRSQSQSQSQSQSRTPSQDRTPAVVGDGMRRAGSVGSRSAGSQAGDPYGTRSMTPDSFVFRPRGPDLDDRSTAPYPSVAPSGYVSSVASTDRTASVG
jgi:hypothetical protein